MLYQLGDIKFERLNGPTTFTREEGVNIVEQPRIEGKPTVQIVGGVLDMISLDIYLHYTYGGVRTSVAALKAARLAGKPLKLINGTGWDEGEFLIESISTSIEKTDNLGFPLSANLSIRLKEYVSGDVVDDAQLQARKNAFATIQAKPIEVNPVSKYQSGTSLVMRDVVASKAAASTATSNIRKANSVPALTASYLSQAARGLKRAKDAAASAKGNVDAIAAKISNAVALKSSLDSVISSISNIQADLTIPNAVATSAILDQNLSSLLSVASQLTNVVATRK